MKKPVKKILLYAAGLVSLFAVPTEGVCGTIIYCVLMVPFAILLGELTSDISEYIGEKKGGLLAACIGNIPELTIGIWSISFGMISMVKAALIGSIISNILLVLGISIFSGGVKYKEQNFNKIVARTNFTMLILAMAFMIIVAALNNYTRLAEGTLVSLSVEVSVVLMVIYILGLIFSLYTHRNLFVLSAEESETNKKDNQWKRIFAEIIISAIFLYFISGRLVSSLKTAVEQYNLSQEFLGIVLIPLLGNIGENFSAILCAVRNKINLSLEIAIGSSIQISLFVTPMLIIFSYTMGIGMTFLFSGFQIVICVIAVLMSLIVFQDGRTYWFEGAVLIAVYMVVILAYYYMV